MRALIAILTVLVLALTGSWAWVRFGPGLATRLSAWRAGAAPREERSSRVEEPAPASALVPGSGSDQVVRVQVLNGTREGGVASRLASYLREGGFHVVEVRNADRSDYFATLVVSRRDDPTAARAVARYLGKPPVVLQARSGEPEEVTVVIGSDRSRVRFEP